MWYHQAKTVLYKNSEGRTTFITRMLGTNHFEAECKTMISPVIAFSIALSSIVGPSIGYSGEGYNNLCFKNKSYFF